MRKAGPPIPNTEPSSTKQQSTKQQTALCEHSGPGRTGVVVGEDREAVSGIARVDVVVGAEDVVERLLDVHRPGVQHLVALEERTGLPHRHPEPSVDYRQCRGVTGNDVAGCSLGPFS